MLCWVSLFIWCYAECHYAECCYAECHNAACCYAECRVGTSLIFTGKAAKPRANIERGTTRHPTRPSVAMQSVIMLSVAMLSVVAQFLGLVLNFRVRLQGQERVDRIRDHTATSSDRLWPCRKISDLQRRNTLAYFATASVAKKKVLNFETCWNRFNKTFFHHLWRYCSIS
jgi:hypothetical protein